MKIKKAITTVIVSVMKESGVHIRTGKKDKDVTKKVIKKEVKRVLEDGNDMPDEIINTLLEKYIS